MTQQVRKSYRNHRKGTWAAVLVVLVAVALAIVLPATASHPGSIAPDSEPLGALAITWNSGGGGTFSCSAGGAVATNQFLLPSPSSGTYEATATNGQKVKIGIAISTGRNTVKDKYLSFRIVGGLISDVGIKGGTTVATYDYGSAAGTWAEADGFGPNLSDSGTYNESTGKVEGMQADTNADGGAGLHAPRDNSGNLYSISQLTICYEPVVKISGYVYRDTNGSGTKESTEVGLGGRTVNLSDGTVATSSSSSSTLGLYEALVPPGTYTLCSPAQTGEVQTQPAPSTSCSGVGGYGPTNYTTNTTGQDFGFAGGVEGACATSSSNPLSSSLGDPSAGATVIAKFQSVAGNCKVLGSDLVFTTYTENGVRVARLSPVGSLGGTCTLASGLGCQIVAQQITWNLSSTSPDTSALRYDDPPYGAAGDPRLMKFCLKDPLDPAGTDGVTLRAVGTGYYPVDVLPTGETSCLIKTTQGPGPSPKRIDQVYSAYDGKISFG